MLLSIVMPVYNVELYLLECIESILNQNLSLSEYEIILINDGSTDESLSICKMFADTLFNIKVIDQKNQGQSVARNEGLKVSKGKYIYFIDSDDYLRFGYLKGVLELLENKNLDFIGFNYERTSARNKGSDMEKFEFEEILVGNGIEIIENHNFNNGPCWYIFKKEIVGDLKFEI